MNKVVKKKWHRNELTLKQRVEVIRMKEMGSSCKVIAAKFACSMKQIQQIIRSRDKYLEDWETNKPKEAKRNRKSHKLIAADIILNEWIQRFWHHDCKITDEMLLVNADTIANIIDIREKWDKKQWLMDFKKKYKLYEDDLMSENRLKSADSSFHLKSLSFEDIVADIEDDFQIFCETFPVESVHPEDRIFCESSLKLLNSFALVRFTKCIYPRNYSLKPIEEIKTTKAQPCPVDAIMGNENDENFSDSEERLIIDESFEKINEEEQSHEIGSTNEKLTAENVNHNKGDDDSSNSSLLVDFDKELQCFASEISAVLAEYDQETQTVIDDESLNKKADVKSEELEIVKSADKSTVLNLIGHLERFLLKTDNVKAVALLYKLEGFLEKNS